MGGHVHFSSRTPEKKNTGTIVISLELAGSWIVRICTHFVSVNGGRLHSVGNPVNDGPNELSFQPPKVYLAVGIPGAVCGVEALDSRVSKGG